MIHKLYSSKKIFAALVAASLIASCKKLPDGFISPQIRYEESPILVNRGRTSVSSGLNFDGSSIPATIQLLHVYDAAGNNVDGMFFKEYTIKGWSALYDPATDTTLALIQAKQTDINVTPLVINSSSGQVEANYTTSNIPSGNYTFDLRVTNGAGSLTYPKIGNIQIMDSRPYDADPELGTPLNVAIKVGDENTRKSQPNPIESIEYLGEGENLVLLKITDKNGKPFNPKTEIQRRPNAGLNPVPALRPNLQGKGLGTVYTDSTTEVSFGFTPFPLLPDPYGYAYRYYYRIPTAFIIIDNLEDNTYSSNPSFVARFFTPGKYLVTVQIPNVTHK